jgi:hypothetical protein
MQDLAWQAEQRRAAEHLSDWQRRYGEGQKAPAPLLAIAEVVPLPG